MKTKSEQEKSERFVVKVMVQPAGLDDENLGVITLEVQARNRERAQLAALHLFDLGLRARISARALPNKREQDWKAEKYPEAFATLKKMEPSSLAYLAILYAEEILYERGDKEEDIDSEAVMKFLEEALETPR
jgi:ClpP class serine protease